MYSFKNDYSEGCHPNILKALAETNKTQQEGYGDDQYSIKAKELIKEIIRSKHATVHFVSGGTQANLIVISSILKPHEAVISAHSGHINVHEAGAIEATGHKVCTCYSQDGKLTPKQILEVVKEHNEPPHMVKPRLVYISNATEVGTVYNLNELQELSKCCKDNNLLLYIDGARLGVALITTANYHLTLADVAKYSDVFYIGGTKNGALLGEAIVIPNKELQEDFPYHLKQKGALMAKGRVLGIQFLELFTNNLFFELAEHANSKAMQLVEIISDAGYKFLLTPESNQIFPIFPQKLAKIITDKYECYPWQVMNDNEVAIRMVCSWATSDEAITDFEKTLKK
ncbi:L-threonine aldolase [Balneicella halophila]|uniref:L-threonine aldolase n=1 Tax=Balneicella halophila TaxID=1537566 RepID=A0A7L4URY2_BALHA|nr:aminotransferase class I/II-fold pyridoxal phosphate-dependent enzyme [Balneicella halophila]PVX52545.1 L-threonine aldolase [Balneicella halophila]